ncbi:MAG: ABC transporter permease [Elusimicrobia bacterium]|nr:ABC transporter permease [Elusimicrobiota bacterium]
MDERTFWGFFLTHRPEIWALTLRHAWLVGVSLGAAALVGLPLGVVLDRKPKLAGPVLWTAASIQTIPSVALLALLLLAPVVGGIGARPAVTALFLYSLLAIIEGVYAGLRQVDPALVETGRAMGMTERQLLTFVELPLALPSVAAGLRLAAVMCVATATVAAYVGAGGLGDLIFRGVGRANDAMVAWGAVPAIAMSLFAHGSLTWVEKRLTRRARRA